MSYEFDAAAQIKRKETIVRARERERERERERKKEIESVLLSKGVAENRKRGNCNGEERKICDTVTQDKSKWKVKRKKDDKEKTSLD